MEGWDFHALQGQIIVTPALQLLGVLIVTPLMTKRSSSNANATPTFAASDKAIFFSIAVSSNITNFGANREVLFLSVQFQ